MSVRTIILAVLSLLAALPAGAGIVMREVQTSESKSGAQTRTVMDLSAEGDGLRSDMIESVDNPIMPPGSYMLFPSSELIYLVNPANKTYMQMDMGVMAGMQQQGQHMQEHLKKQGASIDAENIKINKKLDEAGPVMLGMPTQHIILEVSYERPVGIQMPGISNTVQVHETHELWTTKALEARFAGIPAFKRAGGHMGAPGGGTPDLKEVSEALASQGTPLKKTVITESKFHSSIPSPMSMFSKGGAKASKTSMEITEIRDQTLSADLFVLPKGYTEVEMMSPNSRGMPDLNQLPGSPGAPGAPGGPKQPDSGGPQMPDLNSIPK